MESVRIIDNITKEYSDMIKVIIYKDSRVVPLTPGAIKRRREEVTGDYHPSVSSLSRTKTLVKDIVLCNNFELFCTFTFAPDKVDRFSLGACWHKMSVWLHHQADRSRAAGKRFDYLVIPEQHKNGAWHFHALISGYVGSLVDSGKLTSYGRKIYNLSSYRSGFSTAVPIDDKEKVSSYVTKYITKSFVKKFNQRRFFCSRSLKRPVSTINSRVFSKTPPLFRKKVLDNYDYEIYELQKDFAAL